MLGERENLRAAGGSFLLIGIFGLGGCGFDPTSPGGFAPPTLGSSIIDEGEDDNDLFEAAERHSVTREGMMLQGELDSAGDIDVYDLGPVVPGDRVVAELAASDGLKGVVALFDDNHDLLLVNDYRNIYLGVATPFIDVVLQRPSQHCYVAVAAAAGTDSLGSYGLITRLEAGTALPEPRPDSVLLDFIGGPGVRIGGRTPVDVPVFDAADIDDRFAGTTDRLIELVVRYVREDFEGFNVTILSTSEGDGPAAGQTRLYFGTLDEGLLGVAEGVDEFNLLSEQEAIVFTDTFRVFNPINPSVDEMARALANVASHEIGHLLGLVHTRGSKDIMDVTASLSQLTLDQYFGRAPLFAEVFPTGAQDSALCLLESVGGDPEVAFAKAQTAARRSLSHRDIAGPSARAGLVLSSCDLRCGQ